MSARDKYSFNITCPQCGNTGRADWSEYDRPSIYSGNGRRLDDLSDGFARGTEKDADGDPTIICTTCEITVPC